RSRLLSRRLPAGERYQVPYIRPVPTPDARRIRPRDQPGIRTALHALIQGVQGRRGCPYVLPVPRVPGDQRVFEEYRNAGPRDHLEYGAHRVPLADAHAGKTGEDRANGPRTLRRGEGGRRKVSRRDLRQRGGV